ncbi:glycosyltransferase [Cryobacterium sp.]|jgi:D-inositol-3-phosphate glycosyltransferase|uniref:glycosyltransferase n=1 Tax=Cryobacterium sp. TaxID=1926290 RepID=UPI00261FF026|nr:glycosyltransferase [Cryobacterium sp.]MCU1446076.1 glycosyl transferase, group 1 [Cryobacterium sp.]
MKIALVSEHASPLAALGGVDAGGQNVHVAALACALARLGHTVTVYTRRDDDALPERVVAAPGVEVVHITAGPPVPISKDDLVPLLPELAAGIAADWRTDPPDLVHGHFWMSGVACLAAVQVLADSGAGRIPVVQTFHALGTVKRRHQGSDDTSPPERQALEPWVGQSVDAVIATCSDEVLELRALGVDPRIVSVVPCGVDLGLFRPDGPREEDKPRNRTRVAVVGRLVPRKGVDLVIAAVALLRNAGRDDLDLIIVGGGRSQEEMGLDPDGLRLKRTAADHGVAAQVILRGQVAQAQLPALLRSVSVVVCAPWYEPFGITPLEAMACGVPVVVAAVGGLTDSVVDGVTGIHVPPRDPAAIAMALGHLLDHPDEAARLGRAGHARVQSRYSWDLIAAATVEVYRSVLTMAEPKAVTSAGVAAAFAGQPAHVVAAGRGEH